ncbi:conserved membrane protein of unknown function [Mesotoga infera]|jgi:ABC-2 type transport system permease protein|uniref:ABC transporter permease n=1 Tax=Mesotoga infera TaxID=1236046 RepID=A0A7Z7LDR8_9BACT|nr:ABC-2 family transporter protein [Mesotoga infera]SSC11453.1 conserved membrane protein of unknown function [Mesotoga infera]
MRSVIALFMASLKAQYEYRLNFWLDTLINGANLFSDFLLMAFLMLSFKEIGGWSLGEIAVIYSIVEMGWGIFRLFGEGLHRFEELMVTGRFDLLLIRPMNTVKQLLLERIDFRRLGVVIEALAVAIFGFTASRIDFGDMWLAYIVLVFFSTVMTFEINIILAAIAFWTVRNSDIIVLAFYSTRTAAMYPAHIYGPVLKNVLTFIVPLATVAYFPVGYLTGRITSIIALISPVLGVTALLPVTVLIWKLGLKHYASTGT